jgi:hypothetical protein
MRGLLALLIIVGVVIVCAKIVGPTHTEHVKCVRCKSHMYGPEGAPVRWSLCSECEVQ